MNSGSWSGPIMAMQNISPGLTCFILLNHQPKPSPPTCASNPRTWTSASAGSWQRRKRRKRRGRAMNRDAIAIISVVFVVVAANAAERYHYYTDNASISAPEIKFVVSKETKTDADTTYKGLLYNPQTTYPTPMSAAIDRIETRLTRIEEMITSGTEPKP